ncbi:G-box binding factor bZIP transcription factor [Striga asiatica]|uniref:G-box binding factor bZIP transcription factor n=1 Tax=Striga asiatica TaxID=4170 RepID=A0A5A7QZ80_STRAF|nr:G-box binding factor bZIP transcription factor [Striga asiatica]
MPATEPLTRVQKDPALDSQDELLPEEMVPLFFEQDRQMQGKEATESLNCEPVQDEKSLEKDKKISSHQATQKEFYGTLKARVAELRRETSMLNQQLRRQATMCEQLSEDNKLLMDELKKTCEPWVIEILEANNPETNPQTD